jgi:hypothetical protein
MKIRLYSPFNHICGSELDIKIKGPISLKKLICILSSKYSGFEKYALKKNDEELWAHMLVLKNGGAIRLDDKIDPDDYIHILPLASGG